MQITLTPTEQIVTLIEGVSGAVIQARIWEGIDEQGTAIHAYIVRVAVHEDEPQSVHERFGRELQECAKPRPVTTIPSQLII